MIDLLHSRAMRSSRLKTNRIVATSRGTSEVNLASGSQPVEQSLIPKRRDCHVVVGTIAKVREKLYTANLYLRKTVTGSEHPQ